METIEERMKRLIANHLGVAQKDILPQSSFIENLGADSMDTVEIVMALEDEFDIEIPDDVAETLTTFKSVLDYVSKHAKR